VDEERIKYRLKLAEQLISEGKNLHSIQIYLNLIEETGREQFYYYLAQLYEEMGFVEGGRKILSELVETDAENNNARLFYGEYLLRNSMWFEAIEVLNEISDLTPPTIFLIGYAYLMLNEFESSKEYFTKYIYSNKKSELKQEANLYLAKIEYELNNFDSALRYAKNALINYSDFWELNLILAKVYFSLGMFTHANTPIQKAIKSNPKDTTVLEFAGKICFQLSDYKNAERYFSEFIEQSSEVSAEIYTLLAKSFLKQRKIEEANLFFELALKIDPAYEQAIAGKVDLYR
jgi:tetratricopeptide (TPR) repeat protein